jgi:hypothetical protein
VLCCAVLCCAVLCCTVLYCTVLYCAVLCCAVLYCTVLYCTVLCCTVLYCTIFLGRFISLKKKKLKTMGELGKGMAAATPPHTDAFCVIGYFNNCSFSKHEQCAPRWWRDCTETCRSCFNVTFNVNFKIVFKTVHLCISWWRKRTLVKALYLYICLLTFRNRASYI